jgi:hypothetical protein
MRSPRRTANRRPFVGSSVQSPREALTQTGRTSTPCARASRTYDRQRDGISLDEVQGILDEVQGIRV